MVSMEPGVSTAYALNNIQARGKLFIGPQEEIYAGMIVGENARPEDLPVNPCKAKHLTNMRSQGDGKGIQLEAPLRMTLERAIEYIGVDEYVEATPKSLLAQAHSDRRRSGQNARSDLRPLTTAEGVESTFASSITILFEALRFRVLRARLAGNAFKHPTCRDIASGPRLSVLKARST